MYFTVHLAYLTSHSVCVFSILSTERKSTVKLREAQNEIHYFSIFSINANHFFCSWSQISQHDFFVCFSNKNVKTILLQNFLLFIRLLFIIYCGCTYSSAFDITRVIKDYRKTWGLVLSLHPLSSRIQAYVSSLVKVYLLSLLSCSNISVLLHHLQSI